MSLFSLSNSLKRGPRKCNVFTAGFMCLALLVILIPPKLASAETSKPFRTARLTYLTGDVRVQQSGNASSSTAVMNLPLVEGAVLSTGDDGEAEVEFEDGSLFRITPHSGAALVNLSGDSSGEYQSRILILGGLAYFELRGGTKCHYIVDAGGDEISPMENSTLRINFDEPPATISLLEGSAHLTSASGSDVSATAGQTVRAGDPADGGIYILKEVVAPESWDQWNLDRDAAASNEALAATDVRSKYAGGQDYGWSDLDANGNWYDVPGQGEVWQPDAAAQPADDASGDGAAQSGFDPYGNGSWAYTPAGYVWPQDMGGDGSLTAVGTGTTGTASAGAGLPPPIAVLTDLADIQAAASTSVTLRASTRGGPPNSEARPNPPHCSWTWRSGACRAGQSHRPQRSLRHE